MVFSDLPFLFAFLPAALLLYFLVPFRFKNFVLLLTGLLFYSWGEPLYVIIMIISTLIDYFAGRVMERFDGRAGVRKAAVIVSVFMNLSLLAVFKYGSLIIGGINSVFGASIFDPELPLPIGISFFTFQSMSYTIDLYRRNISVQRNIIDFAAFVTMFPQIVAGPIVRYQDVAAELKERIISFDKISSGISRFICGLGKKVLIANTIGELWSAVEAQDFAVLPAATAWLGILAFTFQIYFDFSGYSDMAIGLGRMLGFEFPENFDHPYLSSGIGEFWRRWHMTLGSWFKSYLYFPLGGSRGGRLLTIRNLLIVWFLTGLWHGAGWNFILWGLYYGLLIILERFIFKKPLSHIPVFVRTFITFILVVFGWIMFELPSLGAQGNFFAALFGAGCKLWDSATIYYLVRYGAIFVIAAIGATDLPKKLYNRLYRRFTQSFALISLAGEVGVFVSCIAFLVNSSYNPFLYFNF